jgi:carbamoyltransferase
MTILGVGGIQTDAACALVKDGQLAAAVEEKKIARRSEPGSLPVQAMTASLELAGVRAGDVDWVAIARPLADARETAIHLQLRSLFPNARISVVEHHAAHAASCYYASPFDRAVVLTLDRYGDFRCGARWRAEGNDLQLDRELYFPDSIGDLYGRVTELLGYHANSEEHKVQWLSTSGDDRFVDLFASMMQVDESGWVTFDRTWLDRNRVGRGGFGLKLYEALGMSAEEPVSERLASHIAAGIQRATERAVLRMTADAENVCVAGGLFMNALLVSALEAKKKVFVQPAAGNAGTAIGACLWVWHEVLRSTARVPFDTLNLGPSYTPEQVKQVLENCKLQFRFLLTSDEIVGAAIAQLNEHRILGWMQGRMEFGPRALGNRSILASPRDPYSTENLNQFIKHREPFRKFAASVPADDASTYFETGDAARYLASVSRVRPEHRDTFAPAILGQDAVRVHVVHEQDNPLYYRLLKESGRTTGLPVLFNTSFNLFNDPLVCSPRDAARSFYSSGIDAMIVGNFLLTK